MIDEPVFVGKSNILFSFKNRIGRIFIDDFRSINQLLISASAGCIVTDHRSLSHALREALSDDLTVKVGIKSDYPCIATISNRLPLSKDLPHRSGGQPIVGVDTGIQFGIDVFICSVVCGVHTAIFFVDIANFKAVVLRLPLPDKLGSIILRTIVHNKPDKLLAVLLQKRLVCARQCMSPVVCRRKYC